VQTAGFIASTRDVSNDQLMKGAGQTFQGSSNAGVVVLGTVKATDRDVLLAASPIR